MSVIPSALFVVVVHFDATLVSVPSGGKQKKAFLLKYTSLLIIGSCNQTRLHNFSNIWHRFPLQQ